ncbi:MAG: hypothetical protein BroJett007_34080 [Chloroflexota bacterium]|nr:MAG: hypothetical protein BroJett007_34080 [Chloroflexota bacterium]
MPLLSPDDKLFDHIEAIEKLREAFSLQNKMRGCSLFELRLMSALLSVCADLKSLQRDLADGYTVSP